MAWNSKYWDIVDQFYWTPKYLGLHSINKRHWDKQDDRISIPSEFISKSGSIYTRGLKTADLIHDLHGKEEILNHVFDLTFAIAPDTVITSLFVEPHGFADDGPLESLGREIRIRYGWGPSANVTQPDGVFISDRTIAGVEIKLKSSTWPEQIAKYVALMVWEEAEFHRRDQLGLLFIVPEAAVNKHWKKCGLTSSEIDASFLETLNPDKLPKRIRKLFGDKSDLVEDVLNRLQLSVISWSAFREKISKIQDRLCVENPGEQTLYRLLDGFLAQLDVHRDTGIKPQKTLKNRA